MRKTVLELKGKTPAHIEEVLGRWPLRRSTKKSGKGVGSQVTFHINGQNTVAVPGIYACDDNSQWRRWRNTVPATGGTDLLAPQCCEYLAALLRGDSRVLKEHGIDEPPSLVIMEACTVAKVVKMDVLDALLESPRFEVLQLTKPRAEAIAAFEARGREHDSGAVKNVPAEKVHDRYVGEVTRIKEALEARARAQGKELAAGWWSCMTQAEAMKVVGARLVEVA
ncbi:hypothetical protein EMIHUDRAFT_248658 [Emiliania huxleyi CCMP1516]|uniref:Uncharacterized protein n=2 Tax=Emiliania huxleyi TaxID=2903 RepID=A0A0D3IEP6_EMIH1|nr:hypothetical protein EMIHUDRAFT_248658 [Emiliania huxleyi CCMP1516]EOD09731.1 hypothetical protein EMIHUDRAFT_248658 [Emiliania huxleyi CCMP1516]|eukprot:XP_005762160.1 hypothetical protein EMIHUDRAFT_248658 [Emiliania huxleyi CCMP1516]